MQRRSYVPNKVLNYINAGDVDVLSYIDTENMTYSQ